MTTSEINARLLALEVWQADVSNLLTELTTFVQAERGNCWCSYGSPCDRCQWLDQLIARSRLLSNNE